MAIVETPYPSDLSLDVLQMTVNTDERNNRGQLQSLEAVKNDAGDDVTEAKYDTSKRTNLGKVTVVISGGTSGLQAFKGTAFINKKVENVAVFR